MGTSINHILLIIAANLIFLLVFTRYKQSLHFFVLLVYSLTASIIIVTTFLHLYPLYVLGLGTMIFAGVLFLCGEKCPVGPVSRNASYLMLLVLAFLVLFQIQQDFVGGQDVRTHYLPLSRLLAQNPTFSLLWYTEEIPSLSVIAGYPPTVAGMGALLFSLAGVYQAWVVALMPSFFFTAFLLLLFRWCEEEQVGPEIPFALLLMSPIFVERVSWFSYEAPLMLSVTLLAYMLYKFTKEAKDSYLYYAMLGSSIGLLTKYTAIIFTALLLFYLLRYKRWDKKIWVVFFLLHLPCIVWYSRNIYYFGNPVLPFLNFLTLDPVVKLDINYYLHLSKEWHQEWTNKLFILALLPLLVVWLVLFPLKSGLRERTFFRDFYFLFLISFFLWFLYTPDIRYLFPFFPVAIVQVAVMVKEVRWRPPGLEGFLAPEHIRSRSLAVLLLFVLALGGQTLYVQKIFPDHISPDLRVLDFLNNQEGAGQATRVFTDSDHCLTWYGKLVVFMPQTPAFTKDFLSARETEDFYHLFQRYGISYVVNHPWQSPWEEDVFRVIDADRTHFVKLYEDSRWHSKLWKVVRQ